MKAKTKTAKKRTPKAPPIIYWLVESLTRPVNGIIDDAYAEASRILSTRDLSHDAALSAIGAWVENQSYAYLRNTEPKLLEGNWTREGGTMQVAFQDPSFALGFCLAYQVLVKGGSR